MFCINPYLDKQFKDRTYNCYDFVREVWRDLTGVDLGVQTPEVKSVQTYTDKTLFVANQLTELPAIEDPCIVLMLRKRHIPHIGVYVSGRILHLSKTGSQYGNFHTVTASFPTVKFYK